MKTAIAVNYNEFTDEALIKLLPGFNNGYAAVNGTRLHYVERGQGDPLILILASPKPGGPIRK